MISSHTENPQLLGTLQNKKIYPYISGDTPLGVVFGDLLGTIPKTRQNRLFSFCIFSEDTITKLSSKFLLH